VVGLGSGLSLVIVLWAGGARVIAGRLTVGDLVAFTLYIGLLAWPTMSLGWMLSLWQRGLAAWHRLREILEERSPLEVALDADGAPRSPREAVDVEVRGLTLTLGGERVLDELSLGAPAGSPCAVVGRGGSGKSTLADVVARLHEVPRGTLFFGGRDAVELPVEEVRARIAYAPQSAFLFSASVRDNIGYGLPEGVDPESPAARQRVERAAQVAGLGPDLARLPQGLETLVGERGLTLSGGQRQRVALARALVSDRPLLILDDSLSSVDAETERAILMALRELLVGRSALLISHRLSALQHADQVIVLEGGRVAERGRHQELLERGGLYAELYRSQLLRELLA